MKIFLSYSRADAGNFARHIHRYFIERGHAVFIDINSITIGDPWADSINSNISECDIFAVILTPDSLTSQHVEREVLQAQRQSKLIVPCIHEYVNYSEIKWGLDKIQGIEFSNEYQLVLNLYQKIKNNAKKENEKSSFVSHQKIVQDTKISEDIDALYKQGFIFHQQFKYEEAIVWYDKVLNRDPNYFLALYNKGVGLHLLGKYQEAIKCYDKALEVDPNYKFALRDKGLALAYQGNYQEAIKWYDKALKIYPNYLSALYNKAFALAETGNYQESIEWDSRVIAMDPNNVDALGKYR